jgi:hypothetical protein
MIRKQPQKKTITHRHHTHTQQKVLEAAETGGERAKEVKRVLENVWSQTVESIKDAAETPEAQRLWRSTKAKGIVLCYVHVYAYVAYAIQTAGCC